MEVAAELGGQILLLSLKNALEMLGQWARDSLALFSCMASEWSHADRHSRASRGARQSLGGATRKGRAARVYLESRSRW